MGMGSTPDRLALEEDWPDLFADLDEGQGRAVMQAFAAAWHEGWEPDRDDVRNLTDYARGAITHQEYLRRAAAREPGTESP